MIIFLFCLYWDGELRPEEKRKANASPPHIDLACVTFSPSDAISNSPDRTDERWAMDAGSSRSKAARRGGSMGGKGRLRRRRWRRQQRYYMSSAVYKLRGGSSRFSEHVWESRARQRQIQLFTRPRIPIGNPASLSLCCPSLHKCKYAFIVHSCLTTNLSESFASLPLNCGMTNENNTIEN